MNHTPSPTPERTGANDCSGFPESSSSGDASLKESLTGNLPKQPACPVTAKEKRAEHAIMLLYLFFFGIWSLGLIIGISRSGEQLLLWGLPLWFGISCTIGYAAACVALVWVMRRYFQ